MLRALCEGTPKAEEDVDIFRNTNLRYMGYCNEVPSPAAKEAQRPFKRRPYVCIRLEKRFGQWPHQVGFLFL
jgi:hypothetical protein